MAETFINKVAESGIITLNLESFYPEASAIVEFDMKEYLFMELILKEKDFREQLKNLDVSLYEDKYVALFCSADAVIPVWAYMLVTSLLQPVAKDILMGNKTDLIEKTVLKNIAATDIAKYEGQRMVIKGCGEIPISEAAYVEITKMLRPFAKSIMYGEPCSTVPVFKKPMARPKASEGS